MNKVLVSLMTILTLAFITRISNSHADDSQEKRAVKIVGVMSDLVQTGTGGGSIAGAGCRVSTQNEIYIIHSGFTSHPVELLEEKQFAIWESEERCLETIGRLNVLGIYPLRYRVYLIKGSNPHQGGKPDVYGSCQIEIRAKDKEFVCPRVAELKGALGFGFLCSRVNKPPLSEATLTLTRKNDLPEEWVDLQRFSINELKTMKALMVK